MPRRKRAPRPRRLLAVAAIAFALFAIGEGWFLFRTDAGRLTLGRLGLGDRAHVVRIMGRHAREALVAAGVAADSIRERVTGAGDAPVEWRVGLREDAAPLQLHHAIHAALAGQGGAVLDGRERATDGGGLEVRITVGVGGRPTHAITLVRPASAATPSGGRLALVVFGFGDGDSLARRVFSVGAPFAVAVTPAARAAAAQFELAHARQREVVLHLPLEPVNYPQINPGPGTILVTMSPSQVAGRVRKFVDQAQPVVAVANHMGSLATQDQTVMTALFRELRRERLPFLHVNPVPGAVCRSLSGDLGVLYDEPDVVIDREARGPDRRALDRRFGEALELARERGAVVVWVRASPLTAAWLAGVAEPRRLGGVSLVPLSALLRRPAS